MPRNPGPILLASLLALGALAPAPALHAFETVYTASGRQDPFGPNGASARAIALGGAYVGVSDDASALFWNPAGLSLLTQTEIALHHLSGLASIQQDTFALAVNAKRAGCDNVAAAASARRLRHPSPRLGGERMGEGRGRRPCCILTSRRQRGHSLRPSPCLSPRRRRAPLSPFTGRGRVRGLGGWPRGGRDVGLP